MSDAAPSALYEVIRPHVSEFPDPIRLRRGDVVTVGPEYDGPEGWSGWILCGIAGQQDGWVPAQVIAVTQPGMGIMTEDYSARELTTAAGDRLTGTRIVNGWLWASRLSDGATGWVPLEMLRPAAASPAAG